MKRVLVLVALTSATCVASAQSAPSKPCKFDPVECAAFERYRLQEAVKAQAQAEAREMAQREQQAFEAERKAKREAEQAVWAAARAKEEAERTARMKALDEQRQAEDRAQAVADQRDAKTEAARKERCAGDYKNIRVGMTVERARECVSPSFKRSGQTNTAQGLVTTYKAPRGFFHAIDGRVVQWGKFD
jgi:multidrug efflux pump subunit AcrA (membrane-fusion protein)